MSIYRYINPRLRQRILRGDVPTYLRKHIRARYIIKCVLSVPPWCDRERVRQMRDEARLRSKLFGVKYVLDHDIPIDSPYVCGLTVPENLRIITAQENAAKGSKLTFLQMPMFDAPEQLRLL